MPYLTPRPFASEGRFSSTKAVFLSTSLIPEECRVFWLLKAAGWPSQAKPEPIFETYLIGIGNARPPSRMLVPHKTYTSTCTILSHLHFRILRCERFAFIPLLSQRSMQHLKQEVRTKSHQRMQTCKCKNTVNTDISTPGKSRGRVKHYAKREANENPALFGKGPLKHSIPMHVLKPLQITACSAVGEGREVWKIKINIASNTKRMGRGGGSSCSRRSRSRSSSRLVVGCYCYSCFCGDYVNVWRADIDI